MNITQITAALTALQIVSFFFLLGIFTTPNQHASTDFGLTGLLLMCDFACCAFILFAARLSRP